MKQEVAPHFESPLPYMLACAHDAYPCTGMFCIVDIHPHLPECLLTRNSIKRSVSYGMEPQKGACSFKIKLINGVCIHKQDGCIPVLLLSRFFLLAHSHSKRIYFLAQTNWFTRLPLHLPSVSIHLVAHLMHFC